MTDVIPSGDAGVSGSAVRPVYSERSMRCYAITDQELQHIGVTNTAATFFASVGAACWTLSADLFKDLKLGDTPAAEALAVAQSVQNLSFIAGALMFAVAGYAMWVRHSTIAVIKRESTGGLKT